MSLLKRLPHSLGLLLMVCALTYLMILLVPGDPAVTAAGENATMEQIAQTRERLGLDDPLVVQFARWLGDAVTGDLGRSLQGGASVTDLLVDRFPVTLGLATQLEVSQARLELLQARSNLAQAIADLRIAVARLERAAGSTTP